MSILVLSIQAAGRIYRLGERACVVGDELIRGGLPTSDYEEGIELFGVGSPGEYETDIILPLDVARLCSEGHQLWGEEGELALVDPSAAWESRRVLMRGRYSALEYGGLGTATRIRVVSDGGEDSASYPAEDLAISDDTLGVLVPDDPAVDQRYPQILGQPGMRVEGGLLRYWPATPAYVWGVDAGGVGIHRVLVAGHRSTGTIRLRDTETGDTSDLAILTAAGTTEDALGQPIAQVEFDETIDLGGGWVAGHALTAAWITGTPLQDPHGPGYLRTAGQILRWALHLSSIPIDWPRMSVACVQLVPRLAGYWDQPCSPWQWVRDKVLPLLPISMRYGPAGIYPVVISWQPTRDDAIEHLVTGRDCCLLPPVRRSVDDLASDVRIEYARKADGDYRGRWTSTPDGRYGRSLPSVIAAQTATVVREVDGEMAWETSTATWIASWMSAVYGQPRETIQIQARHSEHVGPGDVVLLSATELQYSRVPVVVSNVRRIAGLRVLTCQRFRRW